MTFTRGQQCSADLSFEMPVLQVGSSFQTVPDYRLRASGTWSF
jgi:hypothetical protein